MNKLIYLLLLTFSCFCSSNTKISVHGSEINITDECTYFVRDIKSAGFLCANNTYEISFNEHSKIAESHERMVKGNHGKTKDYPMLDRAIKKKIEGYTHYYYEMSSKEENFLFFSYFICDYDTCIDIGTTQKHIIGTLFNQLNTRLIEN